MAAGTGERVQQQALNCAERQLNQAQDALADMTRDEAQRVARCEVAIEKKNAAIDATLTILSKQHASKTNLRLLHKTATEKATEELQSQRRYVASCSALVERRKGWVLQAQADYQSVPSRSRSPSARGSACGSSREVTALQALFTGCGHKLGDGSTEHPGEDNP